MPIHWLFTMNTLTGRLYCAMHESSWMFIRIEASGNVDDEGVGMRALHAQRRGHAVAHGAEAAGGHPVVRLLELEILRRPRSEEHTSELQSLMRISYAVFCLKKKTTTHI